MPVATEKLTPAEIEDEKRLQALNLIRSTDLDNVSTVALVVIAKVLDAVHRG